MCIHDCDGSSTTQQLESLVQRAQHHRRRDLQDFVNTLTQVVTLAREIGSYSSLRLDFFAGKDEKPSLQS